jgi:hypothetical protein
VPLTLEEQLVLAVMELIEERNPDPHSLDTLTVVEADLLGTVTVQGVVGNGGLRYWYEGADSARTELVARSFDRIGLGDAAEALRRSLDAFPERTCALGERLEGDPLAAALALWEPLGPIIWKAEWWRAALRYVLANAAALIEVVPEVEQLLDGLEKVWAVAADRLRSALDDSGERDRDARRREIAANEHHAAHAALRRCGPRRGRAVAFWRAMREVAEVLQIDDDGMSHRQHCFTASGYVVAKVEVLQPNDVGVRLLKAGPARWNTGTRMRRLRAHRSELHARRRLGRLAVNGIYDRGQVRLTPMRSVEPGQALVIHRRGKVVARGTVVKVVAPQRDRPA